MSHLSALLRATGRGGIVGAWHTWRLARIECRISRTEQWMQRERETHQDQLATLRHELRVLEDQQCIATDQAARYWRSVR